MSEDADKLEAFQAARSFASMVRHFYEELEAEGFDEPTAIRLTAAYITGLTSSGGGLRDA